MKKLISIVLGIILSFTVFAEARNALLIANGTYQNCTNLPNPVKEVRELKKVLQQLGFAVSILENGTREQMEDALYDFQNKLEISGGIGFFLYSGHGVQVNGKNYLIPVEANIPDERRIATRTIDLDEVMESMQADTNIVILDACRTNPFAYSNGKSLTRGLALTDNKPKNSIIVYSAQPNKVAWDGVFTPTLTAKLLEEKELGAILRDVRKEVYAKTNGEQSPGEYNELITEVYLAGYIDYIELGKKAYKEGDYAEAFEYFSKVSVITDSEVQFELGCMYVNGYGVTQSYEKAAEWYEKAALKGHAEAQNQLGVLYCDGVGVTQSDEKAVEWFEKSAIRGFAWAQYNLAIMFRNGSGVTESDEKAFEWCEKAANQGLAVAQEDLGYCYYYGYGVTQNYEKAFEWYEKAAKQGDSYAQRAIGNMYGNGEGVIQSDEKQLEWYGKAGLTGCIRYSEDGVRYFLSAEVWLDTRIYVELELGDKTGYEKNNDVHITFLAKYNSGYIDMKEGTRTYHGKKCSFVEHFNKDDIIEIEVIIQMGEQTASMTVPIKG